MTVHVNCQVHACQPIAHGEGREKRKIQGARKPPSRINLKWILHKEVSKAHPPALLQADIGRKGKIFAQARNWRDWELMSFHGFFFPFSP